MFLVKRGVAFFTLIKATGLAKGCLKPQIFSITVPEGNGQKNSNIQVFRLALSGFAAQSDLFLPYFVA
jgi:hypothetical protein